MIAHLHTPAPAPSTTAAARLLPIVLLVALAASLGCQRPDPGGDERPPVDNIHDFLPDASSNNSDNNAEDAGEDVAENNAANNANSVNNSAEDVGDEAENNANNSAVDVGLDAPLGEGEIRVATWNVERFFDRICDTGSCGAGSYEPLPSESSYEARADQIAEAILGLDADVVLLQEIEKQYNVDSLVERLGGRYEVAIIGESNYDASLDVVVLARGELLDVDDHAGYRLQRPSGGTTTFARRFLEVHVEIDGARVIVFSTHFKSKSDDDPERRYAEAVGAHELVTEASAAWPDALVVLGGDMNDTPGSAPIDALEESGLLLRVTSDRPSDAVWTYRYRGAYQAIDHLFMTGAGDYVAGSANAVRGGAVGYGGSDHAALVATFRLP